MSSCAEFVRIAAGARALGAVPKFAAGKVTVWKFVTGGREDLSFIFMVITITTRGAHRMSDAKERIAHELPRDP